MMKATKQKNVYKIAFGRKQEYQKVQLIINECRANRNTEMSNTDLFFSLGMEEGLTVGFNNKHTETIDLFISTKREIEELNEDVELFESEIHFKKGLLQGLQIILDLNREYFSKDVRIITIAFIKIPDIAKKYEYAFISEKYSLYTQENLSPKMFFITDRADEIIKVLSELKGQDVEISIFVINNGKTEYPTLREIDMISSSCRTESIFFIKDNSEDNFKKTILKVEHSCVVM